MKLGATSAKRQKRMTPADGANKGDQYVFIALAGVAKAKDQSVGGHVALISSPMTASYCRGRRSGGQFNHGGCNPAGDRGSQFREGKP
jgi:hypothetical protein